MSWGRLDDQSAFDHKVMQAGNAAWGAYLRMAAYSSAHGLDGTVPGHVASKIARRRTIDTLIKTGFLVALGPDFGCPLFTVGPCSFRLWSELGEIKAQNRQRVAKHREQKHASSHDVTHYNNVSVKRCNTAPVPTRPGQSQEPPVVPQGGRARRAYRPGTIEVNRYRNETHGMDTPDTSPALKHVDKLLRAGETVERCKLALDGHLNDPWWKDHHKVAMSHTFGDKFESFIQAAQNGHSLPRSDVARHNDQATEEYERIKAEWQQEDLLAIPEKT